MEVIFRHIDRQVAEHGNEVTYASLCEHLKIPPNFAKRILFAYVKHAESSGLPTKAKYLLTARTDAKNVDTAGESNTTGKAAVHVRKLFHSLSDAEEFGSRVVSEEDPSGNPTIQVYSVCNPIADELGTHLAWQKECRIAREKLKEAADLESLWKPSQCLVLPRAEDLTIRTFSAANGSVQVSPLISPSPSASCSSSVPISRSPSPIAPQSNSAANVDATRNVRTGNDTTGNDTTGNDTTGNDTIGNDTTGKGSSRSQTGGCEDGANAAQAAKRAKPRSAATLWCQSPAIAETRIDGHAGSSGGAAAVARKASERGGADPTKRRRLELPLATAVEMTPKGAAGSSADASPHRTPCGGDGQESKENEIRRITSAAVAGCRKRATPAQTSERPIQVNSDTNNHHVVDDTDDPHRPISGGNTAARSSDVAECAVPPDNVASNCDDDDDGDDGDAARTEEVPKTFSYVTTKKETVTRTYRKGDYLVVEDKDEIQRVKQTEQVSPTAGSGSSGRQPPRAAPQKGRKAATGQQTSITSFFTTKR